MAERLVASPGAFALSPDKLEGDFVLLGELDHAESFELDEAPLLLLPVRIETRFSGDDLKIRIYPTSSTSTTTPLCSRSARWRSAPPTGSGRIGGEPDAARDDLVRELPPRRAVWVARETRPTLVKGRGGSSPSSTPAPRCRPPPRR